MNYRLIVRPGAEQQAINAFLWYEDKATGLGDEFSLSLDACMNSIARNPNIYQKKYKNIRMGILERFPFGVYYLVDNENIIVLSILHFSRNPKVLKKI
jgi:plasmid stabilization system protein ParE